MSLSNPDSFPTGDAVLVTLSLAHVEKVGSFSQGSAG